ncbi:MAG: alcohol dehydrogenase catalytic domain-containing protein [Deltaproteobacteria bacterium]|nr:alcohol dehydrogenase catalytic domain-containing protein [Deltaproteobacteria bacterium]
MKAIVKTKPGPGIEIQDVPKPACGENDILVKILAGSLCGSDVHIYEWTAGYEWLPMPIINGHEFAGEVVEVGENVTGVSVGERITAMPRMPCGECTACRIGRGDACKNQIALGMRKNGALRSTCC